MAAAGSAVGLGNIWKFPYITGENGGGAFVLVYLVCVSVVGLPIMMAELMIGRHTERRRRRRLRLAGAPPLPLAAAGWVSIAAAFVILSFYSVVAGWTLDYIFRALGGSFAGLPAQAIERMFGGLIADGARQLFWHFIFILLCLGIVIGGVQKGIERWSKILMPLLFALLGLLFVNGMLSKGAWQGIIFMFRPDFHRLTAGSVLDGPGSCLFHPFPRHGGDDHLRLLPQPRGRPLRRPACGWSFSTP